MKAKPPLRPNPKLLALWRQLTPAQRLVFARHAKSTPGALRGPIEGRRGISPDLAIRLEKASVRMRVGEPVMRTELNETCGRCEYARWCLKAKLT